MPVVLNLAHSVKPLYRRRFAFTAFILAFLGFGAKAGMIPLHSWLPKAHPAALHASAMMSEV